MRVKEHHGLSIVEPYKERIRELEKEITRLKQEFLFT